MKIIEGKLLAEGMKIGIVAARFNEFIVSKLLAGAEDALLRHGANGDDITAAWVPGAFEIPTAAQKMAQSGKYDAVICLGAVIRGSTSHYDYVCNEVSKGVAQIALQTGVPTLFGVVTTENIEQAIERAGTKAGNKGYDAAMAAIEMVKKEKAFPYGKAFSFLHNNKQVRPEIACTILYASQAKRAISTRPSGRNSTPSASSIARWISLPPKANAGEVRPSLVTTR